jgi:hypothetical protein
VAQASKAPADAADLGATETIAQRLERIEAALDALRKRA